MRKGAQLGAHPDMLPESKGGTLLQEIQGIWGNSRGYHREEGTFTRLGLKPQAQGQSERLPPLDTFSWGPRANAGVSIFTTDLTTPSSSFLLLFCLSSSKLGFPLLHCWWEGKLVQALWKQYGASSKD